ncbi:uncharacterized protein LOC110819644 isoform X1 [Carica papaya]|uniref:uncharacterized protein LOC110819644 isoform X1 n=2 Tax=Carica papaya TaxID=3649 RepID=UPI000B8C7266|nr:uncharacterized protein LOC110819644 isoform X1 [Carica papaya]XP_021904596.1 uncharacterized protein LOC110819644 isoform X1 [Carica papaya]XP_021904598.1 uncharacterized protein LOC110819644 isoform X1 [Carica papaya]
MSNQILQSDHISGRRTGKPVYPYQSAWMSHWVPASSTKAHGHLSPNYEFKEDTGDAKTHNLLGGLRMETSDIILSKEFKEVSEAKRVDVINETPKMVPGELDIQSFNASNIRYQDCNIDSSNNQDTMCCGKTQKSQIDLNHVYNPLTLSRSESQLPLRPGQDHSEMDSLLRGNYFHSEGKSCKPEMETSYFPEMSLLATSTSFQNDKGPSSKIVPYGFMGEGVPMESLMVRQEKSNRSAPMFASKEDFVDKCQSTFFIHGKRSGSPLDHKRSRASFLSQNDKPALLNDCPPSDCQLPVSASKCEKMQNNPGSSLCLNHCLPSTMVTGTEKLYPGCYSLPTIASSADVKTMRICTTFDSVREFSRGLPNFSQTARHLLITEETDVNTSEKGQLFRESTVSLKLKGKMFTEFLNSPPDFGLHCQHAVKLQPIRSSTENEGKECIGDIKTPTVCIKNESSAETDTMDMDAFNNNSGTPVRYPIHLGGVSSSLNKDTKGGKNPSTSLAAIASAREDAGSGVPNTELTTSSQELLAIPGRESSADDKETSTSRTQSLDVEHLLSNAEQPTNNKPGSSLHGCVEDELGSRWVKRLRRSVSDSFGHGTKILKMGQTCSVGKLQKDPSKSWNHNVINSEPKQAEYAKADVLDQPATFLKDSEACLPGGKEKNEEITFSHPWIRRWCHKKAVSPEEKSEGVCEPQSSKEILGEFEKKQFPSIAAMALVGKAMNGLSPCEIRKSGSVIIWNTKGF